MTSCREDLWIKPFAPLVWRSGPLVWLATLLGNILVLLSWPTLVALCLWLFGKRCEGGMRRLVDVWLLVLTCGLVVLACRERVSSLAVFVALVALADSIGAMARDVLLAPAVHDDKIVVTHRFRWLYATALNLVQIVLAFSILVRNIGNQFEPAIGDALTAVYFSAVTFMTVGYGDIHPALNCPNAKLLVLCELGFALCFLLTKLPIAAGLVRVTKRRTAGEPGVPDAERGVLG